MFGVPRRVMCSCWICAICRFRSIALRNPRKSADCADPANAPNRRADPLMKIVCISSSDRTFKITIQFKTIQTVQHQKTPEYSLSHLIKTSLTMYNKNVYVLKSIIETVVFCGKQNLPLRGHRGDRTSIHRPTRVTSGQFLK